MLAWLWIACAAPDARAPAPPPEPAPPHATVAEPPAEPARTPTLATYTARCEEILGPLPPLSCDALPAVRQLATTADGLVELFEPGDAVADGTCDRPSVLSGCVPGSRAGWVENALGSRFHLLCRVNRPTTPPGWYDDIALIGQDASGATCMWGAPEDGGQRPGAAIPRPGSDADVGFWADVPTLGAIACRTCHDGNGIVVTPWIRESLPADVDALAGMTLIWEEELAAYDASWRGMPEWIHPEAAACTGCHALSEGAACLLGPGATGRIVDPLLSPLLRAFPTDRWMDDLDPEVIRERHVDAAGWEAAFGVASQRLLACCGGQRDGCWSEPPFSSEIP